MKRILGLLACLVVAFSVTPAEAWGPKLEVDEDTWIQLGLLGQFQVESAQLSEDEWTFDIFTRRARIMGLGSVHEKVRFFFSTDVPNTGKTGAPNDIVWNDGFVDFQLMPELKIAFGRILVPFSPENQASAAAILGIDYNLNLLKLPTFMDRAFWRDDGFELRGVLVDGLIEYRGGVFRGMRDMDANPGYHPRAIGMVMVNFADAQPGWFYNPNSLGSLEVLSVGGGVDYIANSAEDVDASVAWNAFAKVEQPVGGGVVNALLAYYDWSGPRPWAGDFEGQTIGAQVGFLLPGEIMTGRLQPVVRYQRQDPDEGQSLDTINVGLNYYLKGQAINFKADYAFNDRRVGGERVDAFRFQTQLVF